MALADDPVEGEEDDVAVETEEAATDEAADSAAVTEGEKVIISLVLTLHIIGLNKVFQYMMKNLSNLRCTLYDISSVITVSVVMNITDYSQT